MKTRNLFLMGLIAFGLAFTACNTTDDDMPEIEKGKKDATVSVRVAISSQGTRLTGDLSGTGTSAKGRAEESRIYTLEAWLFNADGTLDGYSNNTEDITSGALSGFPYIVALEATVGKGKQLVVAANTSIGKSGITELADLEAKLENLTQNEAATSPRLPVGTTVAGIGLPMVSLVQKGIEIVQGENLFGPRPGTHHATNPPDNHISGDPLMLHRLHARVSLVSLQFDFTDEMADEGRFDRFYLEEVVMFNVRNQSRILPITVDTYDRLLGGNNIWFGYAYPPLNDAYANASDGGVEKPSLRQAFPVTPTSPVTSGELINLNNAPFFYVFENDDTSNGRKKANGNDMTGTFLVLAGELWLGDRDFGGAQYWGTTDMSGKGIQVDQETGFTYYTIFINDPKHFDDLVKAADPTIGTSHIWRNRLYNLFVTLTTHGKAVVGEEIPKLDVVVDIQPWEPVDQVIKF